MVTYVDEGIIPLSREKLWEFLDLHLKDEVVPSIHSDILTQRTLSREGEVHVVERGIRFFGKSRRSVWKITYQPPTLARWDILEGDGPMATGSFLENAYTDAPGGILIKSRGDIRVTRFPGFLQNRIVRSALDHINSQDIEYLRTHSR